MLFTVIAVASLCSIHCRAVLRYDSAAVAVAHGSTHGGWQYAHTQVIEWYVRQVFSALQVVFLHSVYLLRHRQCDTAGFRNSYYLWQFALVHPHKQFFFPLSTIIVPGL